MSIDTSDKPPENSSPSVPPVAPSLNEAGETSFRLPWQTKVGLLALVVALASVGYFTTSLRDPQPPFKTSSNSLDQDEITKRKPVDEFDLIDADGRHVPFSDYRGNVVILSFWASWCTPCLVELPTFSEIEREFHDRGLRVIPVNVDDGDTGKNFARDFWKSKTFSFPSFFDGNKDLAAKFDVEMLPANFVIDRNGRIVFSGFGANDWSNDQTREIIEGLLDEE